MDIVSEHVIPAYLEANQLIFEYENIGMYNSVIFPENSTNHDFILEIPVDYDLEAEKQIQKSADKGQLSWRLNPVITARNFVNSHINSEETKKNHIQPENISLLYCDDSAAVLKVNAQHSDIQTVYLRKLIKQDSSGIWTIVGYDSKNHKTS